MGLFTTNIPAQHHMRDGLLFIPDISGYTDFVHATDVLTGKEITYELLSAIISQNKLRLKIAEIEGDAVLFYRYGSAPSMYELMEQYALMKAAFDRKCAELTSSFSQPINLSLKVIAHYGTMAEFKIGHFRKLYGEVVVEAHKLLKNSIESDSYLLLSDALLNKTGAIDDVLNVPPGKLCEIYGPLGSLCYTYFDFMGARKLEHVA